MNQTITIDPWFQNKVINTEEKLPLVSRTTCVPYERIPHYEKHKVKKRENQVGFAMLKWYDHHIMMESIFLICLVSWESKWFDSLLPDYWVYQFDSTSSVQKDQIDPVSNHVYYSEMDQKNFSDHLKVDWKTFKRVMTISIRDFVVDQVKDCQKMIKTIFNRCSLKIPTLIKKLFFH